MNALKTTHLFHSFDNCLDEEVVALCGGPDKADLSSTTPPGRLTKADLYMVRVKTERGDYLTQDYLEDIWEEFCFSYPLSFETAARHFTTRVKYLLLSQRVIAQEVDLAPHLLLHDPREAWNYHHVMFSEYVDDLDEEDLENDNVLRFRDLRG